MPSAVDLLNPPREFVGLSQSNPAVADVTVGDLRLDGRPLDVIVTDPVECGTERRLDGASNLTLDLIDPLVGDPPRPKLLNAGIFAKAVDLDIDDLTFRLADRDMDDAGGKVSLKLLFEATAVARLRRQTGAKHASRKDKTRAEFIKSLCDEIDVPFVCPDLHVKQPITPQDDEDGSTASTNGDPGGAVFSEGDSLAVGSEGPLDALLTRSVTTHAVGGVNSTAGRTSLAARHLPKTLLVQLGTNDTVVATFRTNVQAIKQLRGVARIYWVNIARTPLGGTTDAQLNAVLKEEAGDKLKIIDWKGLVDSGQASLPDGVHPTGAGYEKRAKLIAMAMRPTGSTSSQTAAQRKAGRARGSNRSGRGGAARGRTANVTVKGKKATREQLNNMQIASRVADAERASALAELALHCGAIAESGYTAIMNQSGSPYGGVWQGNVRDGTWKINDTEGMARSFLRGGKGFQGGGAIALARAHPDWTPGHIALIVEGSISNFGGSLARGEAFYNAPRAEAVKIMQAFGASGSTDPLANTSKDEPEPYAVAYQFKRIGREEANDNRDEDSWTCMRRLAEEVNWRLWEDAGTIYYMTDDRILRSSVEMTIEPFQDGVYSIRARESNRRDSQEVTVECDARRWQAGPGTVVELYGYGEPLDDRWIVSSIMRPSLWSPRSSITLQRREKALLEPAHELRQRGAAPTAKDRLDADARPQAGSGSGAPLLLKKGTPKEVIDSMVLGIGRKHGLKTPYGEPLTVANNTAANRRHTHLGSASAHAGPPGLKWAADMTNGSSPTPEMDACARELAEVFKIPWTGSGLVTVIHGPYQYQLIYRFISAQAGDHRNHIHFGVKRVADAGNILG